MLEIQPHITFSEPLGRCAFSVQSHTEHQMVLELSVASGPGDTKEPSP